MYAYNIPGLRFSLPAGDDITVARFVTVDANSEAAYPTAGGAALGVSMNEAAEGEVLEVYDGITMVEAGGAFDPGDQVQVGTDGKAVKKTTGIGVGVAITGASDSGTVATVKLVSVSSADGTDGTDGADGSPTQTILYTATNLAAGADLDGVAVGAVPSDGTLISAKVISLGAAAGIGESNTSVFGIKVGEATIASKTFDADTAFPASGVATDLDISTPAVTANSVFLLDVTNGDNVDLPAFIVQLIVKL